MSDSAPTKLVPAPEFIAEPDQATLLSIVSLTLAPEYRVASYDKERVIVKYEPARGYLNLTPQQWKVLLKFQDRHATVPQVLFELISDRRCIPLREFYEVVIKAHECGLLQAAGQATPREVKSEEWSHEAKGSHVRPMVIVAAVGALVAMAIKPFGLPTAVWELGIGWLIACLASSAGYFLAACVARSAEAEVYHPGWRWRTLFPHFKVDLGDAIMGGRETEVDVSLARIAPLIVAMGILPFLHSGISFLLFCAFIYFLSPFWWSPGFTLLHARFSRPTLDAFRHFRFEPNQNFWYALRARLQHTDGRFLRIHFGYACGWLGLVLLAGTLPLRANATELWQTYRESGGLHFTALAMLALLGLMVLGSTVALVWLVGSAFGRRVRTWSHRFLPPKAVPVSPELVRETVGNSILFMGFSDAEKAAVVAACEPREYKRHAMVVTEGDEGSELFMVHSGRVEVLRDTPSGRAEQVAVLGRGDLFGERALLETGVRTRSVRALGNTILLCLDRTEFEQLVLSRMNRSQVADVIQKVGFLHRVPLSATWSPQAMFAFARRALLQSFEAGETLIRAHDDNQYFFIVYEGELAVTKSGKEIARLHTGDFFGEISALQNSTATATIKVHTAARCLVVAKREFLQFLVNDFLVGLHFEKISSERLGAPIFPLKGRSFDILRG